MRKRRTLSTFNMSSKPKSFAGSFTNRRNTIHSNGIEGTGFVSRISFKFDTFGNIYWFKKSNNLDVKRGNAVSYNTLSKSNEVYTNVNNGLLKDLDDYKIKYTRSKESYQALEMKYQKVKIDFWNLKREHENLLQEFNKRVSKVSWKFPEYNYIFSYSKV